MLMNQFTKHLSAIARPLKLNELFRELFAQIRRKSKAKNNAWISQVEDETDRRILSTHKKYKVDRNM